MIRLFTVAVLLFLACGGAFALEVKEITSASGIKAWFVERHVVPLIHVRFAFARGTTSDEKGYEGATMLMAGMMDEGAGPYDGAAFRRQIEDYSISFKFDYGYDNFYGMLITPVQYQAEAAKLLRLALTETGFPDEAVERMRQYFLTREQALQQNPDAIASRASLALALPGHPYAEVGTKVPRGLTRVGRRQLIEARERIMVRSGLKVAIVGDMSEEQAKAYLDQLFGSLPEGASLPSPANTSLIAGPQLQVIPADTAQTLIQFGTQGLPESDPDYLAAGVASFIASSTLNDLVRERRGLSYGVSFGQLDFDGAHFLVGSLKTANATAGMALEEVKNSLALLRSPGPQELQLNYAKAFLKGQFALGFDSGSELAQALLNQQLAGYSSNFTALRNALLDQVTLADVRRVIAKLIHPDKLLVVAVGKPEDLTP
jgi:zinc protease